MLIVFPAPDSPTPAPGKDGRGQPPRRAVSRSPASSAHSRQSDNSAADPTYDPNMESEGMVQMFLILNFFPQTIYKHVQG